MGINFKYFEINSYHNIYISFKLMDQVDKLMQLEQNGQSPGSQDSAPEDNSYGNPVGQESTSNNNAGNPKEEKVNQKQLEEAPQELEQKSEEKLKQQVSKKDGQSEKQQQKQVEQADVVPPEQKIEGKQESEIMLQKQEKKVSEKDELKQIEMEEQGREDEQKIVDPVQELINENPLPFLAAIDHYNIEEKTADGVPLICLLAQCSIIWSNIPDQPLTFETDQNGRNALHYAVEVDNVQAAYWCLSRGARNNSDNFGNTPMMDAIRLGKRRCFLLCLHFQHIDEFLPHVCAKYNRLWQLKVLEASGLNIISSKDDHAHFPLEVAVQNYSYECIEYLTMVNPSADIIKLSKLTDSTVIVDMMKNIKLKQQQIISNWLPLASTIFWIVFYVVSFFWLPYYASQKQNRSFQLLFLIGLYFSMMLLSFLVKKPKNRLKDIPTLLKQPLFPPINNICPSCLDFQNAEDEDHCFDCGTCVRKFHFHSIVCVNKSNEVVWFIIEFFWLYLFVSLIREFVAFNMVRELSMVDDFFLFDFLRALHLEYVESNYELIGFMVITFFAGLQQFFFCLQLVGMLFTKRTYQQITKSQKYPHLYETYTDPLDKKVKLKERRIFMQHKLYGFVVIIKNALTYFF